MGTYTLARCQAIYRHIHGWNTLVYTRASLCDEGTVECVSHLKCLVKMYIPGPHSKLRKTDPLVPGPWESSFKSYVILMNCSDWGPLIEIKDVVNDGNDLRVCLRFHDVTQVLTWVTDCCPRGNQHTTRASRLCLSTITTNTGSQKGLTSESGIFN